MKTVREKIGSRYPVIAEVSLNECNKQVLRTSFIESLGCGSFDGTLLLSGLYSMCLPGPFLRIKAIEQERLTRTINFWFAVWLN